MSREPIKTAPTGVPNLDAILGGGVPLYSVNIITGSSGTGKTILTQQMMYHNCRDEVTGIFFTTLSEPSFKMIRYQQQFDYFDLERLNENLFYVDLGQVLRDKGLDEALNAIQHNVEERGARFIAVDSFKVIRDLAAGHSELRRFGYDLAVSLAALTCTSFLVGEYTEAEILGDPIFAVADGIFYLTNSKQGMQNVRRLNIAKMRGMDYFTGDHPFRISTEGIHLFPRIKTPAIPSSALPSRDVDGSGVQGLDAMTKGGLPQGSVTLVAGGAGTGKTLLSLHFAMAGMSAGEPALYVTFQETPEHLKAIAEGFSWDLGAYVEQGMLEILYTSPVEMGVDEHTESIKDAIAMVGARRVVIDSLMDIEIATPDKVHYKDYVYSLVSDFRGRGITSMLTNEIPGLFGPLELGAHGISFISDNVILLRYVEIGSTLRRGISVLKMRGHQHDKTVCEFEISEQGLRILPGFGSWISILSGQPQPFRPGFDSPMRSLSDLENQVLETLARRGPATAAELVHGLSAHQDEVNDVLEALETLGFILLETKVDGDNLYRWKGRRS